MYRSYGDKNFFDGGILVEDCHDGGEYAILCCDPTDEEDYYQFGDCIVDVNDSWIDRKAVLSFIGMSEDDCDELLFAIGCINYYGIDNFSSQYGYDQHRVSKKDICKILRYRDISPENLNIEW